MPRFSITLPQDLYDRANDEAEIFRVSLAAVICWALDDRYDNDNVKPGQRLPARRRLKSPPGQSAHEQPALLPQQ